MFSKFGLLDDLKIPLPNHIFSFFVLFTELMCCDSIFNLPKRVADYSFTFLCKTSLLVFAFLSFLNLEAQLMCPRNQYTDPKSALDQTLHGVISESFALDGWIFTPLVYKKLLDVLRCRSTKKFFLDLVILIDYLSSSIIAVSSNPSIGPSARTSIYFSLLSACSDNLLFTTKTTTFILHLFFGN